MCNDDWGKTETVKLSHVAARRALVSRRGVVRVSLVVPAVKNKLDISLDPYFKKIANLKVSAHLLIDREGGVIQFVSFNDRAWHAGVSNYKGLTNCNDPTFTVN